MQVIKEWQLKQLREEYPVGTRVELISMDDFFLPIPLRTKERLQSAGGNVHYEF